MTEDQTLEHGTPTPIHPDNVSMDKEDEVKALREEIKKLFSERNSLAGRMGSIAQYMDDADIPPAQDVHKRCKLFLVMYRQLELENKRLRVLLEDFS